jgi:BirA family biotin operon repressor/biotin-[acetyl-CoA-carboxylase] ligase
LNAQICLGHQYFLLYREKRPGIFWKKESLYGFSSLLKQIKLSKNFLLLNKNTLFIGKVFIELEALPSTNNYAVELISKSEPKEGTVISASYQWAGRGQIGSKWESEPGKNLMFSLILYPSFLPLADQFLLSQTIALAVRDFLSTLVDQAVYVKWPNDIYIEDRKVAGILIQTAISGQALQYCVAGIGINVNQEKFSAGLPNPVSLKQASSKAFVLPVLIRQSFYYLEQRYLQLKSGAHQQLKDDYLSVLYGYRRRALFKRASGGTFVGVIRGISARGELEVQSTLGMETFQLKELSLVRLLDE